MAEAVLRVVAAGPHVTVQDGGRPGLMRFGVPASGAMDRKALAIANAALGNDPGAAGIEVSPGGLTLDCKAGPVTLAVAGGGFRVEAGGKRLGAWSVFDLAEGERLTIRPGHWGSWCCLAVAGHLTARNWLGSASTHGSSGLGGGRLSAGQELRVTAAQSRPARHGPIPCPVWARPRNLIHAVPGPQSRFFPAEAMESLSHAVFRLTEAYDRMGVRLSGPRLTPESSLGIPSEPVLRGSIQVAGDGVPAVLLADHQTTGGYPKIATVIADDIDGFVQCRPRDPVRFRMVSPEAAVAIARRRARAFDLYLAGLSRRG